MAGAVFQMAENSIVVELAGDRCIAVMLVVYRKILIHLLGGYYFCVYLAFRESDIKQNFARNLCGEVLVVFGFRFSVQCESGLVSAVFRCRESTLNMPLQIYLLTVEKCYVFY